jgi:hypothetical protein
MNIAYVVIRTEDFENLCFDKIWSRSLWILYIEFNWQLWLMTLFIHCFSTSEKLFFLIVSKNVSQLQILSLNHFWFPFLAYIYFSSCMYAHFDIFQTPSGIWNRHAIFYWLESTQEKFFTIRKIMHIYLFFSCQCTAAWKTEKYANI